MDLDEIRQILDMMRQHDLAEFELERDNVKLRLRKNSAGSWNGVIPPMPTVSYVAPPAPVAMPVGENSVPAPPVLTPANEDIDLAIVKSPIVGTFYRSAEPGAEPFAREGDYVKKGQVLCIIEAMKLMNEIESEHEGQLVKCYVENGQAVQYGERLFAVKPA